jgi:hypothetical protein
MDETRPAAVLPPAWMEVLDRVQEALASATVAAAEREQAMPAQASGEADRQPRLAIANEPLRGLQDVIAQAGREAADADAGLAASEDALHDWLKAAASLAKRHAVWPAD